MYVLNHTLGSLRLSKQVCMGETSKPKPSPEPVLKALKELGEENAIMFGDTPDDQRAAVAAGVTAIGVLAPGDVGRAGAVEALLSSGAAVVLQPLTDATQLSKLSCD